VRTRLPLNASWNPLPWLEPYARVLHINNTGAAFGMFQSAGNLFTLIAVVVIIVILYYSRYLPENHWWMRLALGLQLGGAVGNLIDRLVFGTVTDFISIFTFAIFNLADASISVGVAILAVLMLVEARAEKQRRSESSQMPVEPADLGEAS
jgi:signal peptidase II